MAPDPTPASLTAKNDLLWVPYNAVSTKDSPQRRTIFSHVQSNSRAQKIRAEAKKLRASALQGHTSSLKDASLRRISQQGDRPNSDRRSGRPPRELQNQESLASRHPPEVPPLLSPLGKGNSDPFYAYSITIGPEENRLLTLYRDQILPSVYFLNVKSKHINNKNLSELANRDWRDNIAGLAEKGTALATLARFGAMASRFDPNMKEVTLSFLVPSTRILRDKVRAKQALDNHIDCLHINMLFNTEIINQNVTGAVFHGTMLLNIFKFQWSQHRLDYKMLLYQLHNDLQMTSTFLVRPVFDKGDWLPMVLKPLWDAASQHFDPSSDDTEEMDASVEHEVLVYWFKQRRQMARYERLSAEKEHVPPLPLVTTSNMATSFLFHSRMINLYLDLEDELEQEGLSDEVKCQLYAQQFLALAGAQLRRWAAYRPRVKGVLVYDDSRLLSASKSRLEECEATSARLDVDRYAKARLWALYVGALVERGSTSVQMRSCLQWFNLKLAESALLLEINTWNDLRTALETFWYEESTMVQGSVWFEELLLDYQLGVDPSVEPGDNPGSR